MHGNDQVIQSRRNTDLQRWRDLRWSWKLLLDTAAPDDEELRERARAGIATADRAIQRLISN